MQDSDRGASERYGETLSGDALASPAAERNKQPILEVLQRVLPATGTVLEVASGTGQHVVHFAQSLPKLSWQPSDPDARLRAAIEARIADAALANVRPPLALDVLEKPWPLARADAIVCINMIHIAPWAVALALFAEAERLLQAGAPLVLYGPYRRGGRHTAPSNEAFDASLRSRNPEWGIRDLDDVERLASGSGFALQETVEMPANNLTVVFQRRSW
jgi:SAM-dependent methyltransferase